MKLMIDLNTFCSTGDEQRFFHGLNDNTAVSGYRGIVRQLEISIVQKSLTQDALQELIALFRRYQIPLTPLAPLAHMKRYAWLADEQWDWHGRMFPSSS